jgi:galactose mutarotase-like enzyme
MNDSTPMSIRTDCLEAVIHPIGAELQALRDSDKNELLWCGDPAIWSGRAPLLFPIVGALAGGRYRLGDTVYQLPRHGFARSKKFRVVAATPSSVLFRLESDQATLAQYPFQFALDVSFSIEGFTLSIVAKIQNRGTSELPASFGFHPAFSWPLPYGELKSDHCIVFDHEEPAPIRRLDLQGLLSPAEIPTPVRRKSLALHGDLFENDALIFDRIDSRRVRYGGAAGPQLEIEFPDTPYLGIWTKRRANFVCIEPWHGLADFQGFSGDFREKAGVFRLAPGHDKTCSVSVKLINLYKTNK